MGLLAVGFVLACVSAVWLAIALSRRLPGLSVRTLVAAATLSVLVLAAAVTFSTVLKFGGSMVGEELEETIAGPHGERLYVYHSHDLGNFTGARVAARIGSLPFERTLARPPAWLSDSRSDRTAAHLRFGNQWLVYDFGDRSLRPERPAGTPR